jgi:hypothetical protein
MTISEFTLHNVLRTYSRQDRLGKVQKAQARAGQATRSTDQVSLSLAGRKIQLVGQLAAEVVDRRHPDLASDERSDRVRSTADTLVARHRDAIADDSLGTEGLEARLRPLYLS